MKPNRFWYNNGRIDKIEESGIIISSILMNSYRGIHIFWRTSGSRIPFFDEQFKLMLENIRIKNKYTGRLPNKDYFFNELKSLLHRNRVFKGSLIHIFLMPAIEGLTGNKPGMYLFTEDFPEENFLINNRGWILENIQSLTRKDGKVVELPGSSIFVVKDDKLFTPSLELGVQDRAIRQAIIRLAPHSGLSVVETDKLESKHLLAADELFAANDIDGIKWIAGYKTKRYFRKKSELINDLINEEWMATD